MTSLRFPTILTDCRRAVATAALICASLCAFADGVRAQDGAGANGTGVDFRYWMAPANQIDLWPWGDQKYYPIRIDRFQDWLNQSAEEQDWKSRAQNAGLIGVVTKLHATARLVGNSLDGACEIWASPAPGANSEQKERRFTEFPVSPFSMALSLDAENSDADPADALAVYPDGRFYLPSLREGAQRFRWSQRGRSDSSGTLVFDLAFPAALESELVVETSSAETLTISTGALSLDPPSESAPDVRVWRAQLGGRSGVRITVRREGDASSASDRVRRSGYRQDLSYRISPEGVEVTAKFDFDRTTAPVLEASITLEEPLEIMQVEWDGVVFDRRASADGSRIFLTARRHGESPGELRVVAFCPLAMSFDRLPSIRLSSSVFEWRETMMRLSVIRPLVPTLAEPLEAAQTRDPSRQSIPDGSALAFKLFEPGGSARVRLHRLDASPSFDSATDCLLAIGEATAKTTLLFSFSAATGFRATLPLAKGWDVDSVQTGDDEQVAWSREVVSDADDRKLLRISFSRPPTPNQATKVVVSARRAYSAEETIAVDSLCPFDLSDVLQGGHALALRADASSQIRLSTRAGRPFSAPAFSPSCIFSESLIREALPQSLGGARLWFGDQTADAYASLENARANYAVDLSCACDLSDDGLRESWKLRCVPAAGARVDRLVFYVSPAASASGTIFNNIPWTWSTATEPDRVYSATPLTREEADALHAPDSVDAYEIRLATSRSVPFELNVFSSLPSAREIQVPLLFFPKSNEETAEIVLDSSSERAGGATAVNAIETTPPVDDPARFATLKKAFRYDPAAVFTDPGVPDANESGLARATDADSDRIPRIDVAMRAPNDDSAVPAVSAICWYETYDSCWQSDGPVSHRVVFCIENRGGDYVRFDIAKKIKSSARFDREDGEDEDYSPEDYESLRRGVRAVWLDGEKAMWETAPLPDVMDESGVCRARCALDVRMLPGRRFVCVEIEYSDDSAERFAGSRIRPFDITCEAPALSGVWNAWLPPQYVSRESRKRALLPAALASVRAFAKKFAGESEIDYDERLRKAAERVAARLGDDFALTSAISRARRRDAPADEALPRIDAPVWGDVFGSPALLAELFAPEPEEDDRDDAKEGEQKDSGAVNQTRAATVMIDRFAFARAGISPRTPLPKPEAADPETRGDRLLETAGIVLLFLDDNFILATTSDVLAREKTSDDVALFGTSFKRPASAAEAARARDIILAASSRRFVYPPFWRDIDEAVSPWNAVGGEEVAKGWTHASLPLGRAGDGIYVVNRYMLSILSLFSFLATLAFAPQFRKLGPRFLVGFTGAMFAALYVSQYEIASLARGALWGVFTICVFMILWVYASGRREKKSALIGGSAKGSPNGKAPDRKRKRKEQSEPVVLEIDDSGSTEGFVDFEKMPPQEAFYIRSAEAVAPGQDAPDPGRSGKAASALLLALALSACATVAIAAGARQDELRANNDQNDPSARTIPTPPDVSPLDDMFPIVGAFAREDASAGFASHTSVPEPRRVFVPDDGEGRPVGEYYWVDSSLYEQIRAALRNRPAPLNWRVVSARYEGAVNYNSFTGATSLFNLKATCVVVTTEPRATIALPAAPLASDAGARFDRQPISPAYDEKNSLMLFDVEAVPGVHTLELNLTPPLFTEGEPGISIPILKVADARLKLDVSVDAPRIDAPNALGRVERTARTLTAELGPVDQLVITRDDSFAGAAVATPDVEQYFLLRPRAAQTDARAAFRYQIAGGRVRALEIKCDPAWTFSGYCKCDAAEIESVDPPSAQDPVMRIVFKKPAAGALTLNADFVAKNFSGVGRLPLPEIRATGARVVKNVLAVAPGTGVECDERGDDPEARAAFMNGWGELDSQIALACNLDNTSLDSISTRLRVEEPEIEESATCIFKPSTVEMRLEAAINAPSDLFRIKLAVPEPFAVDSVALFDSDGAQLDAPGTFFSSGELTLALENPIRGSCRLVLTGRSRERLDAPRTFPALEFQNVRFLSRVVRAYCSQSLCLQWENLPRNWTRRDEDTAEAPELDDPNLFLFGAWNVAEPERSEPDPASDVEEAVEADPPYILATMNAPVIAGVENVFLYPVSAQDDKTVEWKAAYELRRRVVSGRADRIAVAADDLFEPDAALETGNVSASGTSDGAGTRAYFFDAGTRQGALPGDGTVFFTATFKGDPSNVRLPDFRLLASPLSEDFTRVRRNVILATRRDDTDIAWETRGLPLWTDADRASEEDELDRSSSLNRGARALLRNGVASTEGAGVRLPWTVEQAASVDRIEFTKYRRTDAASVALSPLGARIAVTLAQHSFYVNDRREIFGVAVFMLQQSATGECVVVAPPGCRALEATVNGARRLVERIRDEENNDEDGFENPGVEDRPARWRVDLGASPYVKRLAISFQSSGRRGGEPVSRLSRRRAEEFQMDFLRIEDAEIAREVWTCAFEDFDAGSADARWKIRETIQNDEGELETLEIDRSPALIADVSPALRRLALLEGRALVAACESDSAKLTGARADDAQRFAARQLETLRKALNNINQFASAGRGGLASSPKIADALVVVRGGRLVEGEQIDDAFPEPGWSGSKYADPAALRDKIAELVRREEARVGTRQKEREGLVAPESLWALEAGESVRTFVGSADCELESLVVVATPRPFDFFSSRYAVAAFILMATGAILQIIAADSRSKKRRTAEAAGLVFIWSTCFFFLNWKVVALTGAFLLALAPPAADALLARLGAKKKRAPKRPADDSSLEETRFVDYGDEPVRRVPAASVPGDDDNSSSDEMDRIGKFIREERRKREEEEDSNDAETTRAID